MPCFNGMGLSRFSRVHPCTYSYASAISYLLANKNIPVCVEHMQNFYIAGSRIYCQLVQFYASFYRSHIFKLAKK